MTQKFFFIFSVGIIVLMSLSPAYSDFYKYVDENGVVSYTDNLTNVSKTSQGNMEKIEEIVTEEPEQTDVKEGEDSFSEKDPVQTRKDLELMKIDLDKEYNSCKTEQDKLIEEKTKIETVDEQMEFNEKTKALHKRIEAYNKKNEVYKKLIADYNSRIVE